MLWTVAVILFVLWALGLVASYTLSGFIHVLLVLAIVVLIIGVIQGPASGSLSGMGRDTRTIDPKLPPPPNLIRQRYETRCRPARLVGGEKHSC